MPTGYSKLTGENPFKNKKRNTFSQEHRLKISLSKKGKPSPQKGKKGKLHSQETRKKMSTCRVGEKHPKWKGGDMNYWRRQTLIRDNYTCQICGLYDPEILEVDHIQPRAKCPELTRELSNLISLCPNCHRRKTIRNNEYQKYGR